MTRVAFVNGSYEWMGSASISIEDRGFQFGDAIYEVIHFVGDFYVDAKGHLDRLERSLLELTIPMPLSRRAMMIHIRQLRKKNRVHEGFVYMQVSRGEAPRNHLLPKNISPTFVMTVRKQLLPPFEPKKIITEPDVRWGRCDIKTTNLLPNIILKQKSFEKEGFECWMITPDQFVSEGTLSNAWIVKKGCIYTAPTTCNILGGITRSRLIALAKQERMPLREESFTLEDAYQAEEAFNSSSNSPVTPITKINDRVIADGYPGPISQKLYEAYMSFVKKGSKNG